MKTVRVLVTGANGFVGSKIIEGLLRNGNFRVSGLVRKTSDLSFLKPFRKKIRLFTGDIRAKESLLAAFKNQDAVIHAAAFPSDWGAYRLFHDINVRGTRNVCELCLANRVGHLLHISSISVYGFGKRVEACESTKVEKNPFPYCRTKLEGEETVRHFMEVFGLAATILQPGNIYGPNDRTTSYKIIEAIRKRSFGLCDSGKHLLSPLYIGNLVRAVLLVIQKPKKSAGKTYIVTDDLRVTWREFTGHFCRVLKMPLPWLNLGRRAAYAAAFISEGLFKLLGMKTPPLVTCYRISLIGGEFHFTPSRIMKDLGYRPDRNIKKNIEETVRAYDSAVNSRS